MINEYMLIFHQIEPNGFQGTDLRALRIFKIQDKPCANEQANEQIE